MTKTYDAIIIGAGVIGACTAFEMAKKGWKTLSIDKLPEAGYGSTSGSCAITVPIPFAARMISSDVISMPSYSVRSVSTAAPNGR